jgi:hypothetical protein
VLTQLQVELLRLGLRQRLHVLHSRKSGSIHVRSLPRWLPLRTLARLHRLPHHLLDVLLHRHVRQPRPTYAHHHRISVDIGGCVHHDNSVRGHAFEDRDGTREQFVRVERLAKRYRVAERRLRILRRNAEWGLCGWDTVSSPFPLSEPPTGCTLTKIVTAYLTSQKNFPTRASTSLKQSSPNTL